MWRKRTENTSEIFLENMRWLEDDPLTFLNWSLFRWHSFILEEVPFQSWCIPQVAWFLKGWMRFVTELPADSGSVSYKSDRTYSNNYILVVVLIQYIYTKKKQIPFLFYKRLGDQKAQIRCNLAARNFDWKKFYNKNPSKRRCTIGSKLLILWMVIQALKGNPDNGYIPLPLGWWPSPYSMGA